VGIIGSKTGYPWKVSSFGMYVESVGVERNMVDDVRLSRWILDTVPGKNQKNKIKKNKEY
jgi:hypothetical protein